MLSVFKRLGRINHSGYFNTRPNFEKHDFPFQIEPESWSFADNIEDAQIVPFIMNDYTNASTATFKCRDDQLAVNMLLYEIDYTYDKAFFLRILDACKQFAKHNILVHKNLSLKDHPDKRLVYYDSLWDHVKLYYTDFDKIDKPKTKIWTMDCTSDTYTLPKIDKAMTKKYLSMSMIYDLRHPRNRYRLALRDFLSKNFKDQGYIGSEDERLPPNNPNDDMMNRLYDKNLGGAWYPVADKYYNETYITIYVETLTQKYGNVRCVTEKTFDNLAKGNFILPFGYPGLIQDITRYYGFQLPNWIDYHYDNIEDNDQRFEAYLHSVEKLCSKGLAELHGLYFNEKQILLKNRQIFYDKPYDSLYKKLKDRYHLFVNS
jgi:hypothetical protein